MQHRIHQERPSRFDLNVPITFRTEDGSQTGHCVNVSAQGLLAVFEEPAELFTVGEISLLAGEFYINIKARVARTHGTDAGLAFIISTDNDRLTSRILVDFAAARMQPTENGKI